MASLLDTLRTNVRHADSLALFEIGRGYWPSDDAPAREPRRLAIAMTGARLARSWLDASPGEVDFFDLKGVVETLLTRLGLTDHAFRPAEHPTFQAGCVAELVLNGQTIGVLGEVHPAVREHFELRARRVVLAEFDLDALLELVKPALEFLPLSRFPAVVQDLAIIVDEVVPAQQVLDLIRAAGGQLVRGALLFDLYRGAPIPAGKKSLAYSLTYQADDRTLTDAEVARVRGRIVERLKRELGAELRA